MGAINTRLNVLSLIYFHSNRVKNSLGGSDMDDSDEGTDAENPYPVEGKFKSHKEKMEYATTLLST